MSLYFDDVPVDMPYSGSKAKQNSVKVKYVSTFRDALFGEHLDVVMLETLRYSNLQEGGGARYVRSEVIGVPSTGHEGLFFDKNGVGYEMLPEEVGDLRRWGLDPTFTTDSSPVLQRAGDYLGSIGGGTLAGFPGVFQVASVINPAKWHNVALDGGGHTCVFKFLEMYSGKLDRWFYNGDESDDPANNAKICRLVFDGNDRNMGVKECFRDKVIKWKGSDFVLREVRIQNEAGRGFITNIGGDNVQYLDCEVYRCGTYATDSSVFHPGQRENPCKGVVVNNIFANLDDVDGLFKKTTLIDGVSSSSVRISDVFLRGGNKGVIWAWYEDSQDISISNLDVETSKGAAIHIYSKSATGILSNLNIHNCTRLGGSSSITITGRPREHVEGELKAQIEKVSISNVLLDSSGSLKGSCLSISFVKNIRLNNVVADIGSGGFRLKHCDSVFMSNTVTKNTSGAGLKFQFVNDLFVTGHQSFLNAGEGALFHNCSKVFVTGSSFISNGVDESKGRKSVGMRFDGVCNNVKVVNTDFSSVTSDKSQRLGIDISGLNAGFGWHVTGCFDDGLSDGLISKKGFIGLS